jgi:hypothetical protein
MEIKREETGVRRGPTGQQRRDRAFGGEEPLRTPIPTWCQRAAGVRAIHLDRSRAAPAHAPCP